jgi:hypothetical protein
MDYATKLLLFIIALKCGYLASLGAHIARLQRKPTHEQVEALPNIIAEWIFMQVVLLSYCGLVAYSTRFLVRVVVLIINFVEETRFTRYLL